LTVRILTGDCREVLPLLEAESVHCCVTSPPYYRLRDYGHEKQIGLEDTPQAYIEQLVSVFREVRRVLRDDGTLWLNLGDCYAQAGRGGAGFGSSTLTGRSERSYTASIQALRAGGGRICDGNLREKQLLGIPWRVALALQADGWFLRQDNIWAKPNPMPESVRDRTTRAHEYVFQLSKSADYFYDADAIAERAIEWGPRDRSNGKLTSGAPPIRGPRHRGLDGKNESRCATEQQDRRRVGFNERWNDAEGRRTRDRAPDEERAKRNRRSVWTIASEPFDGAHFAVMPRALADVCILAGSPLGGTVVDPFAGSGTVGEVATALGRHAILVDVNGSYALLAEERTAQQGLFSRAEPSRASGVPRDER